ncbi:MULTISPECIES: sensor histidine kinase [Nocardia]|uniref:sensor histidine kinase n=1 Tax=Nocardia TaxID=1817 RepID=UPI0018931935|nr:MULTISPECIES: ATP-binding protein [Nocardia]MBF6351210.1 sensor histidine kinase [Nocardia flavorosea]
MYESVVAGRPGRPGPADRRHWTLPALALAISVTAGVGLVAGAMLSVAPADRMLTAIWISVAVVTACTAVTTAVYVRGLFVAEQQRRAETAHLLSRAEARVAAAEQAVAVEKEATAASERRRSAAIAALANASGRMQSMTTSMLAELQDLEHRYADQAVLADLLKLDHATAQAGRLADSIAILSGARTGRRWAKPIVMERVLRAAIGRVGGYQRVRMRAIADIAIAGHAAEGVIHALSELVDNACRFSPPTTEVHIYAAEIPAGVVVTIEDSGLVMSETSLRRAQNTVSGTADETEGLSSLNGTRFGLAVVGRLARKHGLTVSYRPSAIGGTAAVVMIPRDLTARIEPPATPALPAGHSAGQSGLPPGLPTGAGPFGPVSDTGSGYATVPGPVDGSADTGVYHRSTGDPDRSPYTSGRHQVTQYTSGQFPAVIPEISATTTTALPKRRRGSTLAAAHPEGLPDRSGRDSAAGSAPEDTAANLRSMPSAMGAFQRAVTGRAEEDSQPFGGPIRLPGDGAAQPARHSTTTDWENDR